MTKHKNLQMISTLTLVSVLILFLFGCGGGGGGGTTTAAYGTLSGAAVKGPVSGATVTAYAIINGIMDTQLASGTTDSQGNYTIFVGDYSGPVMLQMSGGTYTDEATGITVTMAAGDVMTAVIPSATAGSVISGTQITPLTAMAQAMAQHMAGGMTAANISWANHAVGDYFLVSDILHTQPMDPLVPGSGAGATQDMKNYGMVLAAMSQYAKDIGMYYSSGIVTSMMDDAYDGVMNGMMGGTSIWMGGGMMGGTMMQPTAGTSGLATAMIEFIGSSMNRSGVTVTDMQALINKLSTCNGHFTWVGGTQPPTATVTGTLSGKAFNGSIRSATVVAYAANYGMMGGYLSSGATDSQGNFTLSLGTYSGPVMLRMMGGTYSDLATGSTATMFMGDVMTVVIPSVSTGASVTGLQITPLTSMAQSRAQYMIGGLTDTNIAAANTAIGNYFMVNDILYTEPMNSLLPSSGTGATQDAKNYGMTIAAMSQYAKNLGLRDSLVVTAMMKDASDGIMNGMMSGAAIWFGSMGGGMMGGGMMGGGTIMPSNAGTSGLAAAMTQYIGSTVNKSGVAVTDVQALIDQLSTSTGTIQ